MSVSQAAMLAYLQPIRYKSQTVQFVCLFAWGLTALSAQKGYIAP